MTGTLFQTRNSVDGQHYRGSVVQLRKYVTYVSDGFIPGTKEKNTVGITEEASVGRGKSFLSLVFPAFVIGYASNLPPNLNHAQFCDVVREITTNADTEAIRSGTPCQATDEICRRYRLLSHRGFRLHRFTFRPVPHLFLLDRTT